MIVYGKTKYVAMIRRKSMRKREMEWELFFIILSLIMQKMQRMNDRVCVCKRIVIIGLNMFWMIWHRIMKEIIKNWRRNIKSVGQVYTWILKSVRMGICHSIGAKIHNIC